MVGIHGIELEAQISWLKDVLQPELVARMGRGDLHKLACRDNGEDGYGPTEADVLHCFVCRFRPQRIIQIGCGVSTAICLRAAEEIGYRPSILCIEPYPTDFIQKKADEGLINLLCKQVQNIDSAIVHDLSDGDLFFIDSTHTLGPAGEVSRIVLELLPRLRKGVIVHFHDIMFPYDYNPDIVNGTLFFPHESVLLHAFLTLNADFSILASLSMLHHKRPADLKQLLCNYQPAQHQDGVQTKPGHIPSSLFLKRIEGLV